MGGESRGEEGGGKDEEDERRREEDRGKNGVKIVTREQGKAPVGMMEKREWKEYHLQGQWCCWVGIR